MIGEVGAKIYKGVISLERIDRDSKRFKRFDPRLSVFKVPYYNPFLQTGYWLCIEERDFIIPVKHIGNLVRLPLVEKILDRRTYKWDNLDEEKKLNDLTRERTPEEIRKEMEKNTKNDDFEEELEEELDKTIRDRRYYVI